jgi:tRNA (adenine37-N6)-methyltransferase
MWPKPWPSPATNGIANMHIEPIGFFYSSRREKMQSPRQPNELASAKSIRELNDHIELVSGKNFEQALEDLDGFSHAWILFSFHLNIEKNTARWRPKVQPPRFSNKKRGVFSTRSPYRPNPLGLSLVEIESVQGLKIYTKTSDLLHLSPVFDIKPYIHSSDSVTESRQGWRGDFQALRQHETELFQQKKNWLIENNQHRVIETITQQIDSDPRSAKSKRIRELGNNEFIYSYRLWRVHFLYFENQITLLDLNVEMNNWPQLPMNEQEILRSFDEFF